MKKKDSQSDFQIVLDPTHAMEEQEKDRQFVTSLARCVFRPIVTAHSV